ncbi:hypothetical protein P40081_00980 [Paenibacillus sp. FSL P4-0081]|uniref:hypothetical protein n=1 Tax=Paenibacillus sp. FSL P4-0081 TaxID=1536769 RepID=UPI0004F68D5D|nr:hypothetical protein [Paenibacillus sp. FSL P4-0081]AIQ26938.1 hypothetical protein P40081_00980 [Paenibacillus sp. FSL P4-0081]
MDRNSLVAEAKAAGTAAKHNIGVIRKNPEAMLPGEQDFAEAHLNNMIRIAELEMKNDRLAGRSQLRFRLKSLVVSILTVDRAERKGDKGYVGL